MDTKEVGTPELGYQTDASQVRQLTRKWPEEIAPTSNAEVVFVVQIREPQQEPAPPRAVLASVPTEADEPSQSAEAEITYREVRGRFRFPGRYTHHVLDTVAFGLGIVGMVAGPVAILKLAHGSLPPEALLTLCAIYLAAFTGLTATVIHRRRG